MLERGPGHSHGAVNVDWRKRPGKRQDIPRDHTEVNCRSAVSLSARAMLARRLSRRDKVKAPQDGFEAN
ncbi:MAG: hypothetical protein MUC79_10895 [Thiobacillaceae bacterium]|nr:hypothetical protein [Thiobacillaceae bacterium]